MYMPNTYIYCVLIFCAFLFYLKLDRFNKIKNYKKTDDPANSAPADTMWESWNTYIEGAVNSIKGKK